jgi:hypothetical protein
MGLPSFGGIIRTPNFGFPPTASAPLPTVSNLAERALSLRYAQPELADAPAVQIVEGRHPVVEHFNRVHCERGWISRLE